jgi:transcriptional regulator PpsR
LRIWFVSQELDMTKRPQDVAADPGTDLGALSHLAPELAATFATVASDIALVIDRDGVIRNVAVSGGKNAVPAPRDWVGRAWADTVTDDTRRKIEQLLLEANETGVSQRREVTVCGDGGQFPIAYAAVRLGEHGPVLAVGRDLRAIAAIQQRFIESQQEMERDYWKRRQAEARYRLLFQVATDAVLVIDAATLRVVEANRAAAEFFALAPGKLVGQEASLGFDPSARQAVDNLLVASAAHDRPSEIRIRSGIDTLSVSSTPFRADDTRLLLLRVRAADATEETDSSRARLAELVERTPDAIVVTDMLGRIRLVNPAFLELSGLPSSTDLTGRMLSEWLGQGPREFNETLDVVRRNGMVARIVSRLRGLAGAVDIELSAARLPDEADDQDSLGFTLRPLARSSTAETAAFDELTRAVERLASRVGSVILPSLMREGAELVERHLLQTALARSGDDEAAAARLLGISEDSLMLRLQRQGLRLGGDRPSVMP